MQTVDQASHLLRGYTMVHSLELNWSPAELRYDLKLVLANDAFQEQTVSCINVSAFKLPRFGGGISQFMLLRFEDVRVNQWDGASYELHELEHEAIFLRCQSFVIEES